MYNKHFFLRQDGVLRKIDLDSIVYIEAAKNYTKFYSTDDIYMARITFDAAMDLLPENKFLRVHRSFAAAADHIDVIERDSVRFISMKAEIPVSRKWYAALSNQVVIMDTANIDLRKIRRIKARKGFKQNR
jgi:DNA-binding LytR/AlgR family response regulator